MAYAVYWMDSHGGALLDGHLPNRFATFCPSAVSKYLKSQSGTTPKPAAPVAHFEQQKTSAGSSMASKSSATGSAVASTGSASKTNLSGPDMTLYSAKGWSKSGCAALPSSVSKPTQPKDSSVTETSTAASTVKVDPAKSTKPSSATATSASTTAASRSAAAKASTATTKAEQTKVQVEVPPKAPGSTQAAPPLDPLDALAFSLPSEAPKRPEPKYTGPEVKEDVTSEEGVRVGEREDTLPPGYRLEDMPPVPADAKPADVPKPMSTADALDVLSGGFLCETPQKNIETISAASKAPSNFAPAPTPTKKSQAAAPPADKKAKLDTDLFSLSAAVPSAAVSAAAPPADKKPKMDSGARSLSSDLSLDALNTLGGLLPSAEPPKPEPTLRPEDIVSEATVEDEEAVRVGEREDTLPPEYRLKPGDVSKLPAPKPQPTMDTSEALDILSGDFCDSSSAPSTQQVKVSPAPALDKKARVESDSFSLEAGLTPSSAQKVESSALPPQKKSDAKPQTKTETKAKSEKSPAGKDGKPAAGQSDLSLDALNALGGLLPSAEPRKPEPELRPEDVVSEATVEDEEAVRVGEREDALPPEYRLKPGDISKLPASKPQPTMDTSEALDILSGDFCDSSSAPSTQTAAVKPTAPPAESLSALDSLSQDFVSPSKSAAVKASAPAPAKTLQKSTSASVSSKTKPSSVKTKDPKPNQDGSMSSDALSALEDLLPSAEPPKPEPVLRPEDIVSEATVEDEEAVRVGEREDTLPPEYRLKPGDISKLPASKPQPTMDTSEALDILSGDFCDSSSAPSTQTAAAVKSATDSALDALSGDFVAPSSAPSTKSAADAALDALSGDFVASSAAPTVQSSSGVLNAPDDPLAPGADSALDALSDALKDIAPTPQPEPAMPTNIVKEKQIEEERLIKMGERDDTLPPEYRPTEEELKKMQEDKNKIPESPKEKPMDDKTALDLLAGDFSCPAPAASSASTQVSSSASAQVSSSAPSDPQKPMSGDVLTSLSDTLLPQTLKKTEKPKKSPAEGAAEQLSSQLTSDVLPSSKS